MSTDITVINTEEMIATPMTLGEYSEISTYPLSEGSDKDYPGYRLKHKSVMFPACYHTWVSEFDFNIRFKVVNK
jgi:hypothetical protein